MRCYSILIGARQTVTAASKFSRADDDRLRRITFSHFPDGFTILNADGGWFDPAARRFIKEESRQILVCASNARALRPWCDELAEALGQSELLVVEHGAARSFRRESSRKPGGKSATLRRKK